MVCGGCCLGVIINYVVPMAGYSSKISLSSTKSPVSEREKSVINFDILPLWQNLPLSPPFPWELGRLSSPDLFLQGSPLQHDVSSGIIISNQSLVVQRVTRSDAGQYTCHVFNSEGEGVSNEVHLAVKCRKLNSIKRLFPLGVWSWLEHYKHVFIL